MDLIKKIRRENGCDEEMLLRAQNGDPDIMSTIKALQGNTSRGLERFSDELYSKSTHFLLELIQNADDNTYAPSVLPELCLTLVRDSNGDAIMGVQCNEVGFRAEDVVAICKVGASTKKNVEGYIGHVLVKGEKGIGFKSVFRVADVVHIASGDYKFKLDRREELGMITPIWDDSSPARHATPGWTAFVLELSKSEDPKEIAARLVELSSSLLLFLRRLRSLSISIGLDDPVLDRAIVIKCIEAENQVVQVQKTENGIISSHQYFMTKETISTFAEDPRRQGVSKSEIVLAFPVGDAGKPHISPQTVHAFLPLRDYGFTFIIQADFLTSANREDVLHDSPWNTMLRRGIIEAFISTAMIGFKSRPALQFSWLQYLPDGINDVFFLGLEKDIITKLKNLPILCGSDCQYRKPTEFLTVPAKFCDENGTPLIPEKDLPNGMYYLSDYYDLESDGERFARLGVPQMSEYAFIAALQKIGPRACHKPDRWHELVCYQLYLMQKSQDAMSKANRSNILRLMLLPLSDGSWACGDSATKILFNSDLAAVPNGLGVRLIKSDILPSSWRYRFFESLGVRIFEPRIIASQILEWHRKVFMGSLRSLDNLINDALFMFVHRQSCSVGLRVMDEQQRIASSNEVYCDFADTSQTVRMREVLRSPARFLHPAYLHVDTKEYQGEWLKWLREVLLVNVYPRLIDGVPAPEFMNLPYHIPSQQYLVVLKETWPTWSGKLSRLGAALLSNVQLECENGSTHRIGATFLRIGPLGQYEDLPFLPVQCPSSVHWQFLRDLGVSLQIAPLFFLQQLRSIRNGRKGEVDIDQIYAQLEARFDDDPDIIRWAFAQEPLIFSPFGSDRQWFSFTEAVWTGPPSMTSKLAVKSVYPSLEKFFKVQLGLPSAGLSILASEICSLAKQWKGKIISIPIHEQVLSILHNISQAVMSYPLEEHEWLIPLRYEPIFPVSIPSKGLILCSQNDHFYVPDTSAKFSDMFGTCVPLLAVSSTTPIQQLIPLLHCTLFSTHMRHLDSSVTVTSSIFGDSKPDFACAGKYKSRFSYIERLVHHGLPSPPQLAVLDQLRSMTVHSVHGIQSDFSLESFHHHKEEEVIFNINSSHISVSRVRSSSPGKSDVLICHRLADLLGVQMDNLLTLISHNPDAIDMIMKMKGIPLVSMSIPLVKRSAGLSILSRRGSPLRNQDQVQESDSILSASSAQSDVKPAREPSAAPLWASGRLKSTSPLPTQSVNPVSLGSLGPVQIDHSEPGLSRLPATFTHPTPSPSISKRQNTGSESDKVSLAAVASEYSVNNVQSDDIKLKHVLSAQAGEASLVNDPVSVNLPKLRDVKPPSTITHSMESLSAAPPEDPLNPKLSRVIEIATEPKRPVTIGNLVSNRLTPVDDFPESSRALAARGLNAEGSKPKERNNQPIGTEHSRVYEVTAKIPSAVTSKKSLSETSNATSGSDESNSSNWPPLKPAPSSWQSYSADFELALLRLPHVKERVDSVPAEPRKSRDLLVAAMSETDPEISSRIGTAGEYYIYCVLQKKLPGFGPDNWTSELRIGVPGFDAYQSTSLSDITYADDQGILTDFVYGAEKKHEWNGRWPTYHLEVKSTTGVCEEPFHMSARQLGIAFNMSVKQSPEPPTEIFALIRVSSLLDSPTYTIYPDSHRLLHEGSLRITSNVSIVPMVS
ncbi:hypothetical protein FIBSPDRAFT_900968 [Athelia psychrophila]|uniref:Protein NO VEIN C-terminal domain-containing protein n=1 Tax=Athelia psychrophila TaxID=1759441 RepID=A0A165XR80_9AGAM|nr:hypothetical protein FIBSPDRAFT_900968 [Fibularhizoctonia sp. CBS 109695]